jgi:hypothetical protein
MGGGSVYVIWTKIAIGSSNDHCGVLPAGFDKNMPYTGASRIVDDQFQLYTRMREVFADSRAERIVADSGNQVTLASTASYLNCLIEAFSPWRNSKLVPRQSLTISRPSICICNQVNIG